MKIIILGDTHGEFGKLNAFIAKHQPDIIIITGDFGYWPNLVEEKIDFGWGGHVRKYREKKSHCLARIKPHGTKIYWVDGNHEQHSSLNQYQDGGIHELEKNVFFCSRGSCLNIAGLDFLFIGGAYSIDQCMRKEGVDWFREETISYTDFERAMDHERVDIVVSHTCPKYFIPNLLKGNKAKVNDPSIDALNGIFDHYKPSQWFFGHWHFFTEGYYKGCEWTALNYLGHGIGGRAWKKLITG